MDKKKCIFHIPIKIDSSMKSGSSIRPIKMIKAFERQGYEVEKIMGYGRERKKKIIELKHNIRNGVKYEFLYSESSTMPTLLTEKNHIPKYPLLDFSFFKLCKKHSIPIALFYRDIQWKFPFYKNGVSFLKRNIAFIMYYYDLRCYSKLVDRFYLPSIRMIKWLDSYKELLKKVDILLPGGDTIVLPEKAKKQKESINIFYVGGIKNIYNLEIFLQGVYECDFVQVIICCRKEEWETERQRYKKYLSERIEIVHVSAEKLEGFYRWADVCCAFIGMDDYASMGMPIKLFEYLSYGKPVLGIEKTAIGDFIEKNDVGWSIEYSAKALSDCLEKICSHPEELLNKKNNVLKIQNKHTWTARAEKVINDMKEIREKEQQK